MEATNKSTTQAKELLHAQAHIWNHVLSFQNPMALKCAIELGIPDAIHKHGQPMSLTNLSNALSIHPTKTSSLRRLMRFLVHSGYFSDQKTHESDGGEPVYSLTKNSILLLKDHPLSHGHPWLVMFEPAMYNPPRHFSTWFKTSDNDEAGGASTPFKVANGRTVWEHLKSEPRLTGWFNELMASDSRLVGQFLVTDEEFKGLFEGVKSLVDVGGGYGTLAKAIAEAYPEIKCTVLDLPHAVRGLHGNGRNLFYVEGDMFLAIPPTDVVILKWVLHNWNDEECIKILKRCKEAISSKEQGGGKVVIIDIVIDDTAQHTDAKFLFDLQMMSITMGEERTTEEWKQLFIGAGFSDYKVLSTPGIMSVIEVYP